MNLCRSLRLILIDGETDLTFQFCKWIWLVGIDVRFETLILINRTHRDIKIGKFYRIPCLENDYNCFVRKKTFTIPPLQFFFENVSVFQGLSRWFSKPQIRLLCLWKYFVNLALMFRGSQSKCNTPLSGLASAHLDAILEKWV